MITQHDLSKRPEGRRTPPPITMNQIKRKTDSHIDKGEPEVPKKELPVTVIATGQYATTDKAADVYSISKKAKRNPPKAAAPIVQIAPEFDTSIFHAGIPIDPNVPVVFSSPGIVTKKKSTIAIVKPKRGRKPKAK